MIISLFTYNIEIYLHLKTENVGGVKVTVNQDNIVDLEWVRLVLEAKELGIPIKEIKTFLKENK